MTTRACLSYAGYHVPAEIISHAVWPYVRFLLSLGVAACTCLGPGAHSRA